MYHKIYIVNLLLCVCCVAGCRTTERGFAAVSNFDKERYLGKWYEIARLDFRFERDLNNTTAEYQVDRDGIKVINRGYNYKTSKWTEAVGKAKFKDSPSTGALLVSFFGPFYGEYNIIALDDEYRHALIAGKNLKYLWILSRDTSIPVQVRNEYLDIAKSLGFNVDQLIWVEHDK